MTAAAAASTGVMQTLQQRPCWVAAHTTHVPRCRGWIGGDTDEACMGRTGGIRCHRRPVRRDSNPPGSSSPVSAGAPRGTAHLRAPVHRRLTLGMDIDVGVLLPTPPAALTAARGVEVGLGTRARPTPPPAREPPGNSSSLTCGTRVKL